MPAPRRLTWLDVFTDTPMAGNGLAVVHDADELDAELMLRFARETNLSETTFVQSAGAAGADYRNRIFTPLEEIRFAGHPSLGTAVAVARARGESEARYVQETAAGLQPIEVELAGDRAHASMLQEPPEWHAPIEAAEPLAALGLEPADAHPELPVQAVSTGVFHLMVPVRDAAVLERVHGDLDRLRAVTRATGSVVLYAFAPGGGDERPVPARGLFEVPGAIREDPATGSAAGPLCAYLHRHCGRSAIAVDQGVAMGRPSRLLASVEGDRVRVSGDCVVVAEGSLLV